MDTEIVADLRAQAFAAVAAWLRRDQEGFDGVVGSDEEAAVLLPIVIGELSRPWSVSSASTRSTSKSMAGWMSGVRGWRDSPPRRAFTSKLPGCNSACVQQTEP